MKYIYKIVAALGALAIAPLMFFTKIFYYKITSTALDALMLILKFTKNEALDEITAQTGGKIPEAIGDHLSFYDIGEAVSSLKDLLTQAEGGTDKLDALIAPAIVFLVITILIIVCAIITAIFAFVTKDNRKVIFSSIAGIGLSLMFKEAFECVAAPILEGTVSISSLTGSVWGDLIGTIETLTLTTNFWFIPAVFGAIILWTVLYNYTLPEKEKKERKLMLGEAYEE